MIWNVPEIVANLSRSYSLEPGDLDFHRHAGRRWPRPAGDRLQGVVAGVGSVTITIGPKAG